MRRLDGVLSFGENETTSELKRYSLLFDTLHLHNTLALPEILNGSPVLDLRNRLTTDKDEGAELDFLQSRGFVAQIKPGFFEKILEDVETQNTEESSALLNVMDEVDDEDVEHVDLDNARMNSLQAEVKGAMTRIISAHLAKSHRTGDIVPICTENPFSSDAHDDRRREMWQIALEYFPVPGPKSSWEDVFDFKAEMHDKQWNFRRFLNSLTTKKQTEVEIRDDIEWTLNEYTKAMKIHRLKAGNSFMEVYVMPVIELAEDLAKFNWSKIAKGALSVKKREVEFMEAEMKAPGRECAYVFEAQKRFQRTKQEI